MDLLWLEVPGWKAHEHLLHGFLGRRGGESTGPFSGLNLSYHVGDDPEAVKNNICNVKRAVGVHDLSIVTMRQVHGDSIIDVRDGAMKEAGQADGLATDRPGVFLGVLTADCVPILFCAPEKKLAAVVHAGWRGTLLGLAPKMVNHLQKRYGVEPASLEVALGPAIGQCCYEIGSEVAEPMLKQWGARAHAALARRESKTFLDLKRLNVSLLEQAGIPERNITQLGRCTACAPEEFFSYRRDGAPTGRQMSFIGWLG
ncbi:MAG TPA: peptidoglycan editing factor PgeF [Candidatus Acidoferrales bacterium]|nr:peptidoglycan editing factor PgeF [Candidatus Acidoferrales bacterium]